MTDATTRAGTDEQIARSLASPLRPQALGGTFEMTKGKIEFKRRGH